MDTLEMGNKNDQGSSSDMEIGMPPNDNDIYTAIATPSVREVDTVTHPEGQSEGTQDPQDPLTDVEIEIPAAEMETGINENNLDATEVEHIHDLYEGMKDKSIPVAKMIAY